MPTYEYACQKCGHQFEQFQSMSSAVLKKCPECGKNSLKRLVGAGAGLIFKGSGFYITDYKNKPSDKGDKKEPTAAVTSEPKQPVQGRPAEIKPDKPSKPATESKPAAPPRASKSAAKK